MATDGERIGLLSEFFADSFGPTDLKMFLIVNKYDKVASAVNESVGSRLYFFQVAEELNKRGLIDEAFFENLRRERPAKKSRILDLGKSWLDEEMATPRPSRSTTSIEPREIVHIDPPMPQNQTSIKTGIGGSIERISRPRRRKADPDKSSHPSSWLWPQNCVPASRSAMLEAIRDAVNSSRNHLPLLASVERADGVGELIKSLTTGSAPAISEVVLVRINDRLLKSLAAAGCLMPDFKTSLDRNVKTIRKRLSPIHVAVKTWPGLPPFHGILYGELFFFGYWTVSDRNPRVLSVDNTQMWRQNELVSNDDKSPASQYKALLRTFALPGRRVP
jgi:hypothetical protein